MEMIVLPKFQEYVQLNDLDVDSWFEFAGDVYYKRDRNSVLKFFPMNTLFRIENWDTDDKFNRKLIPLEPIQITFRRKK